MVRPLLLVRVKQVDRLLRIGIDDLRPGGFEPITRGACETEILEDGFAPTRPWEDVLDCELEDASSCPQWHPQQLTDEERGVVKELVTSEEYRHVPTSTLALLAQRLGKVFASATTWHRLVRRYGWRRPRKRVHPDKPKLGIRASAPNEIWHVDTSVVRLLDGTRAYLYAVIDNFSRRILAWRLSETFDPTNTVAILLEASKNLSTPVFFVVFSRRSKSHARTR